MSDEMQQKQKQKQMREPEHMPVPQEQRLLRLLNHTLRGLPHRPAPGTLETRVLGELQRRAAQPWWRRSFAHWPWPARTALVATCMGFIGLALLGGDWTVTALGSLRPSALAMVPAQQAMGLVSVLTSLAALPTRLISPLWLYSALAAGAVLYVMLFGLGAAVYRTLYFKPLGR